MCLICSNLYTMILLTFFQSSGSLQKFCTFQYLISLVAASSSDSGVSQNQFLKTLFSLSNLLIISSLPGKCNFFTFISIILDFGTNGTSFSFAALIKGEPKKSDSLSFCSYFSGCIFSTSTLHVGFTKSVYKSSFISRILSKST